MSKFLTFALRARNKISNVFTSQYRSVSSNVASPKYNNDSQTSNNNRYSKEICLVATGFVGYVLYKENFFKFPTVQAIAAEPPMKGKRETFNFIADAVHVAAPSVVYIEIKDTRRVDYFTGQPATLSNGSGFIVREDGLILTNAHVVVNKPNTIVHVKLHDGNTYIAKLVDIDVTSDLATIRIPMKNLPTMKLGLSSDLKAGEWVVALGSPLTLSNTVTAGVVSSTMRAAEDLGLRGKDITYIQTDAAITFGNSGGPLVNLDGEAIGINSMKVAPGISFAIPIDYAKEFLSRSSKDRMPIAKKYLGITMLSLTPSILREVRERNTELRADITHGVLVWKVIVGSPAHSGGLQPGDIVTHFNGQAIYTASDVYKILNSTTSKTLTVRIIRNNNILELNVKPEVAHNA